MSITAAIDERQQLRMDFEGVMARWCERARAKSDLGLMFSAPFLVLAELGYGFGFDGVDEPATGLKELYKSASDYLLKHAPVRDRTDYLAIDAAFDPAQSVPWFPVWTPESLARGLTEVGRRALEAQREVGFAQVAKPLARYLTLCVPGVGMMEAKLVAAIEAHMKQEPPQSDVHAAKIAMLVLNGLDAAGARADVTRLFDRVRKDDERAAGNLDLEGALREQVAEVEKRSGVVIALAIRELMTDADRLLKASATPYEIARFFVQRWLCPEAPAPSDAKACTRVAEVRLAWRVRVSEQLRRCQPQTPKALLRVIFNAAGADLARCGFGTSLDE